MFVFGPSLLFGIKLVARALRWFPARETDVTACDVTGEETKPP